jgi:hypothetical protein
VQRLYVLNQEKIIPTGRSKDYYLREFQLTHGDFVKYNFERIHYVSYSPKSASGTTGSTIIIGAL